jgi:signal transduction histidine kinase
VSTASPSSRVTDELFVGRGEMARRCREFDWASTTLGSVEGWSQSLRTMADAVLASRNPMLLFWGPDLIQIYNDAFRPSLGPSGGASARHPRALGMRAQDFWTDVWSVVGPQIEGVMTRGEAVWFEDLYLPIERGNGVLDDAWWTYSYSPVRDDDGQINGTLVVCLETTAAVKGRASVEFERKRLADLFQHAPAFICVLRGPDHVFEMTNANYQRLIGDRQVIGKPIAVALPEVAAQGFTDLLDDVLTTGKPYVGHNVPIRLQAAPDAVATERSLTFVYQAITEADGSRSGVFVHGVDVTDLMRARADAEAARAVAESANRAKSEFLAIMSHELRTPLNAIDGYAELLELGIHGPLTDGQRDHLDRIRRSERHLLGLINDVLNYTRIEAGAVRYDISNVLVEEVLASCDSLTAPQRRAKNLVYHCDGCPPGLRVIADSEKMQQVVLNLLTNAIKFTEPGGRLTVTCRVEAAHVRISVADTGRGIPPDQLERVFDPFVQVDAGFTRKHEGVGLGLAISRDLARGMGGELSLVSTVGLGSTFTLTLPAA